MKSAFLQIILICFLMTSAQAVGQQPNIVFVMADDLGWMDLACQGNPLVETPNIDRLAHQGMRFTNAYAAAPVCSPTRAAALTGQSPARLRITNHTPDQERFIPDDATLMPAAMLNHLPLRHVTFAEVLKSKGYRTAFMGKWHLSGPGRGEAEFEPQQQGFDLNVGGCGFGGPPTYFDPFRIPTIPNRREGEYLPDRLADDAIEFIASGDDRPYLLCLWNYAVHWPMEAPEPLLAKYADRKGPGLNDTRYGAMIEAMDVAFGRLMKAIDESGTRDRTIVIFTSDNGGFGGVADNRPLRASKGYLYEGGIRVPLIVRWPGTISSGSTCDTPVISMDYFPTFLELAGHKERIDQPPDGESLLPLFRQQSQLKRDAIYFHYPNYAWHRSNRLGGAVRKGRYKLIERFDDGSVELFDLSTDLSETTDISIDKPDLAAQLRSELARWRSESGAEMPVPIDDGR